jgi:hypothetical protein
MTENVQDVISKETQQPEPSVNLTLKVSEVNAILAALDEMPHKMSRRVIDNVIQQAQAQLQQPA